MRTGWIKIHRKILDNPVVTKDADHLAVWVWLLCEAAYEPHQRMFGKKKITLQPGRLITSAKYIADELNITESKVKRILKSFEIDRQIDQQTTHNGRVISICSWDIYQCDERHDERQVNDRWTTGERQVDETKEYKEIKKDKKGRKKNNIFTPPDIIEVKAYCIERGNKVDPEAFVNFYQSKNWMVGKNKMTDWRAAVRNWERNGASKSSKTNDFLSMASEWARR